MMNILSDINKKIERDKRFIKSEIICKQLSKNKKDNEDDEKYIKFSRTLNAVSVINLTKKQYDNYWITQYKDSPEQLKIILETINDKFANGLTSAERMIHLVENSTIIGREEIEALNLLGKKR